MWYIAAASVILGIIFIIIGFLVMCALRMMYEKGLFDKLWDYTRRKRRESNEDKVKLSKRYYY